MGEAEGFAARRKRGLFCPVDVYGAQPHTRDAKGGFTAGGCHAMRPCTPVIDHRFCTVTRTPSVDERALVLLLLLLPPPLPDSENGFERRNEDCAVPDHVSVNFLGVFKGRGWAGGVRVEYRGDYTVNASGVPHRVVSRLPYMISTAKHFENMLPRR